MSLTWTQSHPHDEPLDQQADLPGKYWAAIGPESEGRWSWVVLDFDADNAEVANGRAASEEVAKQAIERWVRVQFPTTADDLGVTVTITPSAGLDGAVVVFIDTEFEPGASDGGPGLRVLINDDPAYIGVEHRPDPTDNMDDDQIARHNEAMDTDPQYRDAIYYERH